MHVDRGRGLTPVLAMILAVVLIGSLGACASSAPTTPSATGTDTATTATAPTTPSTATAASPTALSSSPPVVSVPSRSSGSAGTTTLTGTVAGGVESGCVVLTDESGAVLANLMGLDTTAAPIGSQVEVTGEFRTDMMTTCQQGKPFSVTAVQVQP